MSERMKSSEFMAWAKTEGRATYHLGSSGLTDYPLSGLPVSIGDLELTRPGSYGYEPLQTGIARTYGVEPETVFATIGTSLANHIAMAALIEPGDEVLIEHPTYELLLATASYLGAEIKRFHRPAETSFQIDPSEISRLAGRKTKLIVLTNLHNPSSALTPEETIREIGRIARRVGARVLVDEVYLDAAFEQSPRSAIHLGREFVVTNSLTKVYGLSGLRCGWVLAEHDLITAMWRLNDLFSVNSAHPAERLSVIAFQNLPRVREFARNILTTNHREVDSFLRSRKDLLWYDPGFGTVVFPKLRHGTVDSLSVRLKEHYDTTVAPGKFFDMPDHFRIGLGLPTGIFKEGLRRLGRALDEIDPTG